LLDRIMNPAPDPFEEAMRRREQERME